MFVGIFSEVVSGTNALQSASEKIRKALDPYQSADREGDFQNNQARLFQTLTHNTPESLQETVPHCCPHSGLVIASWLRLDNRAELAKKLDISNDQLSKVTDPELVIAAYRRWAQDCARHMVGDFSFVIYNPADHTVFAARDAIGVKPLYYYHDDKQLVICSGARALHALDGIDLSPDPEWMALYAVGISTSFTDTPWPRVKKLAPGHMLVHSKDGLQLHRYFQLVDDAPEIYTRDEKYLTDYKAILEQAHLCRLRSAFPLGSETSGGLDSSTVTGFAALHRDRSVNDFHTFGHAYCEEEPSYILETSRLHGVTHNHILTGGGSHDELEESRNRALVLLGFPEEHANGSSYEPFYRLCEKLGVRTLLSGFGGDEVVTNPGHLLMLELIDKRKYWTLYQNLHGSAWLKPLRFARTLQRSITRKSGISHISRAFTTRWPLLSIQPDIADRYSLQSRYLDSASYDSSYRSINQFILGDRWAPFVPTRLDNCTLMAAARKIDYRWPLLDQRLVQQYLSTPSIEKFGGGYGRYLHRRAMTDVAPDKVTWKQSKSMGNVVMPRGYDSTISSKSLIQLYTDLNESLHPTLQPIVDRKKIESQRTMMSSLDRTKHLSQWLTLSMQYSRFKALNDWLELHYR